MAQHTKNNHYIPKLLIRRFSNDAGERFYCEKGKVNKADAKRIFSSAEIYDDKLEKEFNLNESKLNNIFNKVDEKLEIRHSVLMREISIPEWNVLVYNTEEDKEDVSILNDFFIRMNLKFLSANTNKDSEEIAVAREASISSNLKDCNNIVFIKYNNNFCPFVLPSNIPVILPVGMSIVFVTPISQDVLMIYYINRNRLSDFTRKYRSKHRINQAMINIKTPEGWMLCDFVCSDKEYAEHLVATIQPSLV